MALSDSAEYWWPAYASSSTEKSESKKVARERWKHKKYLEREEKRKTKADKQEGS